ncbi:type II secretion system F family protein [Roseomonas sp. 18066]|uniref:type II secretion system F family protein n=1 Tax=Roseomonas sp. 18066 TaxID=2681412 RepID=UPI001356BB16|nr:type II secretion system F family protein [Roseomonas sp. 18066]
MIGAPLALGLGLALLLLLLGGTALILPQLRRQARVQGRLAALRARQDGVPPPAQPLLQRGLAALGMLMLRSGLLPRDTLAGWKAMLIAAHFRHDRALALLAGAKLLLMLALPVPTWILVDPLFDSDDGVIFCALAAAALGLLLPDAVLAQRRRARLQAVERGLPDALDMMVICAEAGLGLEAGIERVALEIAPAHRAVSEEFAVTAQDLRIASDRRLALQSLGARLQLEPLKRLAATLVQTLQYGTPLTQALRGLAAELRQEQLVKFETRAARLPVLLTLPMVAFILPTIFLVLAGPAVIQIMQSL